MGSSRVRNAEVAAARVRPGERFLDGVAALFGWALLVAAAWYIGAYAYVAAIRLRYPFELEWMEGAVVDHVRWILSGKPLYGPPSFDFVPFIYPPLYFYLSAAMSKLTGVGFLPLRLVSFGASLGSLLIIHRLVARDTKSAFAGFVAAGLFAATYPLSGGWFDIARVDSLLLLLLLSVVYLVRLHPRPAPLVLGGVMTWLAFLAKQSGVVMLAPVALGAVVNYGRRSLFLVGSALVSFLAGNWVLDRLFRGWFSYYVFDLPRAKKVVKLQVVGFWTSELLPSLFIAMLISVLFLGYELCRGDRARGRFYLAALLGMVGGSWLFRSYSGVYYNALMPAHATISMVCGLGLGRVVQARRAGGRLLPLSLLLCAACLAQLVLLVHHPLRQLPSPQDLQAGRRLIATLAAVHGEVYIPEHGYLAALAGKRTYAHGLAMRDVKRGDPGPNWERLNAEVQRAIEQRRFAVWVLETRAWGRFLAGRYVRTGRVFDRADVFWPVTGMRTRPESVYRAAPL